MTIFMEFMLLVVTTPLDPFSVDLCHIRQMVHYGKVCYITARANNVLIIDYINLQERGAPPKLQIT